MKRCVLTTVACLGLAFAVTETFATMPTPVAQWSFEDADNLGVDSIGTADLTRRTGGGVSTQAVGRIGQSLAIGKGSYTVPDAWWSPTGKLPVGTSPFTVMGWIKPCSGTGASAYLIVYRKCDGGTPNNYTGHEWNGWNFLRTISRAEGYKYCCGEMDMTHTDAGGSQESEIPGLPLWLIGDSLFLSWCWRVMKRVSCVVDTPIIGSRSASIVTRRVS